MGWSDLVRRLCRLVHWHCLPARSVGTRRSNVNLCIFSYSTSSCVLKKSEKRRKRVHTQTPQHADTHTRHTHPTVGTTHTVQTPPPPTTTTIQYLCIFIF